MGDKGTRPQTLLGARARWACPEKAVPTPAVWLWAGIASGVSHGVRVFSILVGREGE